MKKVLTLALATAAGAISYANVAQAASPVAYYGKVQVNISIDVTTAVTSGNSVYCTATFSTSDGLIGVGENTETGVGTAVSTGVASGYGGTVYSCQVSIPYLWFLTTGTTDTVTGTFSVGIAPSNVLQTGTPNNFRFGTHSLFSQVGMLSNGPNSFSVETRL